MILKIKKTFEVIRFLYSGEGLEVEELQQRISRAELDIQVLIKSMKAVLLAISERTQAIAALGGEIDTLHNIGMPIAQDAAFLRLQTAIKLCKEVGDLDELIQVTFQMFEAHKDMRG